MPAAFTYNPLAELERSQNVPTAGDSAQATPTPDGESAVAQRFDPRANTGTTTVEKSASPIKGAATGSRASGFPSGVDQFSGGTV